MELHDQELIRRVRGVIAVVTEDIDAVTCEVENGVAYIEGVVPSERERRQIIAAALRINGLKHVITCLSTERILKSAEGRQPKKIYAANALMKYSTSS